MKEFTDFRLFKKVVRKYWKRHARKSYFYHNGKRYTSYWTDKLWCYFFIRDPKLLDDDKIIQCFMNDMSLENYLEEKENWKNLLGKDIVAINYHSKYKSYGTFDGFAITNNGAYFGFKNYVAFDGKVNPPEQIQILPIAYQLTEKQKS